MESIQPSSFLKAQPIRIYTGQVFALHDAWETQPRNYQRVRREILSEAESYDPESCKKPGINEPLLLDRDGTPGAVLVACLEDSNCPLDVIVAAYPFHENHHPFCLAVRFNRPDVVQAFFAAGKQIRDFPYHPMHLRSPLHWVGEDTDLGMIKELLAHGASPQERSSLGKTAYEFAQAKGRQDVLAEYSKFS